MSLALCLMLVSLAANAVVGDKWQEVIFKSGETNVTVPVTFETEGISLSTVGRTIDNGGTLDVNYNVYEEKEIDWNNGTKLVITAKDKVTGIVMEGKDVAFASADKGEYSNGSWTGELSAGETLTLTSNDGIQIKKITVLYNGAELEEVGEESKAGTITIQYPTEGMTWATFNNGNKLVTFTTTKSYAQVIIDIEDQDPAFDNIYKFPTRMVDNNGEKSDNLHVGENTITALTADAKPYNFFKGHTYKMIVRGYVNMWDREEEYDAIAEVTFIGDGKEAETLSDVTIDKVFPASGTALPEGPRTIDLTFSAPVKTLKAIMPKGMDGSTSYACTKVDEAGISWKIDLGNLSVESEDGTESSFELQVSGTDTDDNVLNLGANAARALILSYTVSKNAQEPEPEQKPEPKPEDAGAALVVDGKEIALSTEVATEFGELPAGSVFKYVVTKEDTKTVQFQILNVTTGEMLKTMAMKQDANGLSGSVEFELPLKYDLAKGHEYEAQFKEFNAVNGLTIKAPTAEANYKFTGVADVAVYSTVKVVSVVPSISEDINDLDTPITITFTEAIASLDVTAVLGQMSAVAVDAANITPNEDKTAWTVTLDNSYVSSGTIQLNFVAIDNDGNRVTDPNDGVGAPEDCYVNYSWATTLGLPTPTLAEDGQTYETVESITFENDGIGINENNANATWNQITIEKDGTPMELAITEDMFKVGGDASVGGTKLVLTLPATLYKGVYTVKVPARAFMLGHDIENTYNGACSFTFTCTAEEKTASIIDIAVERMVGLGYDAENVEFDGAAVLEMLGLSEWSENNISVYPVDPTTGEQVADYDGWRNDQGVPTAWGDAANGACLKYPHLENGAYIMTLCTFPGRDTEAGKVLPAQWAVNNKATGETVILNVAITLVAAPALSFEVIKTIEIEHYETPNVAYDEVGKAPAFSVADVCEALGIDDISKAKTYIVNVTDGEFVMNTTDGWRDANGDAANWAEAANGFCLKLNDPASGVFDYSGAHDANFNDGDKYVAKWAVTYDGKAVVLQVNITFGEEPSAINSIAASAKANGKFFENGKIVILKNGVKYNVAGSIIK